MRANNGNYRGANIMEEFAESPQPGLFPTPFDTAVVHATIVEMTPNNYVAVVKGGGKALRTYKDIEDAAVPNDAFKAADDYLCSPPGTKPTPYTGDLTNLQRAAAALYTAIQPIENYRARTAGDFQHMVTRAAAKKGFKTILPKVTYAEQGGAKKARLTLQGKEQFSQEQADTFGPYAMPSPTPSSKNNSNSAAVTRRLQNLRMGYPLPMPILLNYVQNTPQTTTTAPQTTPSFFINVSHIPNSSHPPQPSSHVPPPPTTPNYNQDPFKSTTPAPQTNRPFIINVSSSKYIPNSLQPQRYPDPEYYDPKQ